MPEVFWPNKFIERKDKTFSDTKNLIRFWFLHPTFYHYGSEYAFHVVILVIAFFDNVNNEDFVKIFYIVLGVEVFIVLSGQANNLRVHCSMREMSHLNL